MISMSIDKDLGLKGFREIPAGKFVSLSHQAILTGNTTTLSYVYGPAPIAFHGDGA
jgi:hypothetical protein